MQMMAPMRDVPILLPDWNAPANVRAAVTMREGGASRGAWASFNLGLNTGEDSAVVESNRRRLVARLGLVRQPAWLRQVHGAMVVQADTATDMPEADASWTREPGVICAILTADCLPVLFCDRSGTRVAAAHGGWRGLAAGILENTIADLQCKPEDVLAWLGPAIGPNGFEVGPEVRAAFDERWPDTASAFRTGRGDRLWCDIYAIARIQLRSAGVREISGGGFDTISDSRFYSYRRDDGLTGRMASLVWLDGMETADRPSMAE